MLKYSAEKDMRFPSIPLTLTTGPCDKKLGSDLIARKVVDVGLLLYRPTNIPVQIELLTTHNGGGRGVQIKIFPKRQGKIVERRSAIII